MNLHNTQGRRLYLTADERRAFIAAAATADRLVRTLCSVLHDTGCRISEALALTAESIDLSGRAVMFESLKKRRRAIYRAGAAYPPRHPRHGPWHPGGPETRRRTVRLPTLAVGAQ